MPTTQELADYLLETAPEHEGWSLVESSNAKERIDDLLDWARGMTAFQWQLDWNVRRPQLGLVLLWLESEVARRHASDGTLWPVLGNLNLIPWSPAVHSILFLDAEHSTQSHRELLRHAAEFFSLRHTFHEDDAQNYYRLICLQFGFTRDDAIVRLASWLSGQIAPISVQRILEADDSGALVFQEMWRSLRMFRLGKLSLKLLESRLRSNPWALPEWCAELIVAANRSYARNQEAEDIAAAEVAFFTIPRLGLTDQGTPYFTTSLCNLGEFGLDSDEYEFKAGEHTLARLIRQEDGTHYSDAPQAICIPLKPSVGLSLVGSDGKVAQHDEAILWDMEEEVSVFSPRTGLLFPPGQKLRSGVEVYLVASADIQFTPQPAESFDLALGYRLHRIASGWNGSLQALLDDEVMWSSEAMAARPQGGSNGVSAAFTGTLDLRTEKWRNANPPWSLPIRITIPVGWEFNRLRWRRGDGILVQLHQPPAHLTLTEQDAIRPVILRIQITNGVRHQTELLRVPVPFVAALHWTPDCRPRHQRLGRKLLLGDAAKGPWSFHLPLRNGEPIDPRTCSFLEGGKLHSNRLKVRPFALPDLGGYGASLRIVDDPYQNAQSVLEVSPCVLDNGVIGSVRWMEEEATFLIQSRFTGIGLEHCLLAWSFIDEGPSVIEKIDLDKLETAVGGWKWRPGSERRLLGLTLFYRGVRLGSWFDGANLPQAIMERAPGTPAEVAAPLRAWKAPILQRGDANGNEYANWLRQHWVEVLPVWLTVGEIQGPGGFVWSVPSLSEAWTNAVGDLLLDAWPSPSVESVSEIVDALSPGQQRLNAIGNAMWRIAEVCPILAVRVTRVFLEEFVTDAERRQFFQMILSFSDLSVDTNKLARIAQQLNRDGFWLHRTMRPLHELENNGPNASSHAYRLLSKNKDYRLYALGRWLREIH